MVISANEIDLLETGLRTTGGLIASVPTVDLSRPTPCPKMSVAALIDHLVGWATSFGAQLNGEEFDGDPNEFTVGEDPATEYDAAAARIIYGYRDENPAAVELALATGKATLKPEYRGPGKSFGDEVAAAADALVLDRFVAFSGRDPAWMAP